MKQMQHQLNKKPNPFKLVSKKRLDDQILDPDDSYDTERERILQEAREVGSKLPW